MSNSMHPNLAVLNKLDLRNLDGCAEVFADGFVWHYFNPRWPEIEGDYQGISGLKEFFSRINESSKGPLQVNPVDVRTVGDELVVVHVCNRLGSESTDTNAMELDAVVVWRIVSGKIAEAWDIPAVHSVRTIDPSQIQNKRRDNAAV